MAGVKISAAVDGRKVASVTDAALPAGMPGIEAGDWYPAEFAALTAR